MLRHHQAVNKIVNEKIYQNNFKTIALKKVNSVAGEKRMIEASAVKSIKVIGAKR